MSEDEKFLARWSRRKQEVAIEARFERKAVSELEKVDKSEPSVPVEAPAVDLSKLPSLDEITSETDISGFLRQGVPTDLARAALRRAWTSDPAIRDFVGLQENDWVFNKPGPDQGFGPLGPETDVGKLLAQVFGEGPKQDRAAQNEDATPASKQANMPPQTIAHATTQPIAHAKDDAAHNKNTESSSTRHSHGGALPRPIPES